MLERWVDPKYKLLGKKAAEQYPELNKMSLEDAARFIQQKAYKGLPEFRSALGLGSDVISDPEHLERIGAHASSTSKGIVINPSLEGRDRQEQLGYLMHEYGHQLDDAAKAYGKLQAARAEYEKESWLPNPIKKIMKYKDISEAQQAAEAMRKNYPSGKMDPFLDSPEILEYKSAPSNPRLEKDYEHHFKRDFRNENLKRIQKGGLEEVVKTEAFRKLRDRLA
jgi:hypothetical protein